MMKAEEKKRIDDLLHRDKAIITDAVEAAAVREFARIAAEFFELDGDITFSMREGKILRKYQFQDHARKKFYDFTITQRKPFDKFVAFVYNRNTEQGGESWIRQTERKVFDHGKKICSDDGHRQRSPRRILHQT